MHKYGVTVYSMVFIYTYNFTLTPFSIHQSINMLPISNKKVIRLKWMKLNTESGMVNMFDHNLLGPSLLVIT